MEKERDIFRGCKYFANLVAIGRIKIFETVIIVEKEKFWLDGEGGLVPFEANQLYFNPSNILEPGKTWHIEKEEEVR